MQSGSEARVGLGAKLYAAFIFILSLPLLIMGGKLAMLHGSPFYVAAGVVFLAIAVFLWRGGKIAARLYAALLVAIVVWTLAEVGPDPWSLFSRLAAYVVVGLPMFWIWLGTGRRRLVGFGALAVVAAGILAFALRSPVHGPEPFDSPGQSVTAANGWRYPGRTASGTRYAPFTDINTSNVGKLEVLWTYRAGTQISEATPLKIGNALYFCTFDNKVFSITADTGTERWRFDPKLRPNRPAKFCRGVGYYEPLTGRTPADAAKPDPACETRIFTATRDARLIALDAQTGKPCADFGVGGTVDLHEHMGPDPYGYQYSSSPPIVVGEIVVVGAGIYDGQSTKEPSGVIRAFNVHTGQLAWAWDAGRPGINTAPGPGETYTPGTPNVWGITSADPKMGLIFLGTGNAPPDYFAADRTPEMEKFGSSTVALNAADGSVAWSFQTVHHDMWDYDVASQPVLTDFPTPAGPVPAVIQPTKRGDFYILDRATGRPLVPVIERPVPQGAVAGDHVSPTQPYSTFPTPRPLKLREADMWGITPIDQMWCRIKFREARYEGMFTPQDTQPVIVYPGNYGGSNWGSVSIDEKAGVMLATMNNLPIYSRLIPRSSPEARKYDKRQPTGFPEIQPENGAPQYGTPYAVTNSSFFSPILVPCNRPPYGRITAFDLKTQKILWDKPIGTLRNSGPVGMKPGLPLPMGVPLAAGVLVTGGDLSFFGGSQDGYLRAYSTRTGHELWRELLPMGSNATPMTYRSRKTGKQLLVVTAGGAVGTTEQGDYVIAYALPDR